MSPPHTKQRILDAAEHLFSAEGYHGTSLRMITGKAGANLAAVNYHFGSKESLLQAVFERRLGPLNQLRQQRLAAVCALAAEEGRRPETREVLEAFIAPTIQLREMGPAGEDFITLVGRVLAEPDETVRKMFLGQMKALYLLLFEALGLALPEMPGETLFWRLHFALGAMGHTLCRVGQLDLIPEGLNPQNETGVLTEMLLGFVTAGMEAPCK